MLEAAKHAAPAAAGRGVTGSRGRVNWLYFFELLFTRRNLKLVHPVCHDKCGHDAMKCDPKRFYLKS